MIRYLVYDLQIKSVHAYLQYISLCRRHVLHTLTVHMYPVKASLVSCLCVIGKKGGPWTLPWQSAKWSKSMHFHLTPNVVALRH